MSNVKKIPITDIEDFDSVDVVEVLVKVGDEVASDQPLVTVESEKAMMDYPSPYAGVVEEVLVKDGAKVTEGDTLITLKITTDTKTKDNDDAATEQEPTTSSEQKVDQKLEKENESNDSSESSVQSSTTRSASRQDSSTQTSSAYASPGTQKFARDLGVNLEQVHGSGRKQRIVKDDIQQHVRKHLNNTSTISSASSKPLDFTKYGTSNAKDLTKIQKLTAENMLNAWQSIPHVTHFDQADVTQLEVHRKSLASELKEKNIKLTPLAFVVKALVTTLKKFPEFNSSLDSASEQLIFKDFYHIGIAVDTPHGLFVPVLRDADKKSLEQVAIELIELSELARQRKLGPEHMGGASMTISSLGNLGGQAFTPIINPPEVAILGLSKMIVNEKVLDSTVEQQKLLPLSLSYDHRVVNGAAAARFCTHLKNVLEDIWKLIL